MEKRIVRLEDNVWHVRAESGELADSERAELIEYFDEIKLPYRLGNGRLCIPGEVDRQSVFERLEHFYDGYAKVLPF
jgi:hypothetical protein